MRRRKNSLRLQGYDYSLAGLYFLTLCVQKRLHLFGKITNQILHLNPAGKMVAHWYGKLAGKFPHIHCHEMVVMPNHFHCIIQILEDSPEREGSHVGQPAQGLFHREAQDDSASGSESTGGSVRVPPSGHPDSLEIPNHPEEDSGLDSDQEKGEEVGNLERSGDAESSGIQERLDSHAGLSQREARQEGEILAGIPEIMDWFKTMTTNAYIRGVKENNWPRFRKKLWQRSYHDHIIRSHKSYENIRNYIITNPERWDNDIFQKK